MTQTASTTRRDHGAEAHTDRPPRLPGFLMGLGFGGFVDGILLHQILQWHHLVSDEGDFPTDTVSGLEGNMVADGLFHVGAWVLLAIGMVTAINAWQRGRLAPPWRSHIGMLLAGWGVFNIVEGVINHQLLGIHHVRDDLGGPLSWDIGFLVLGAALVVAGVLLARSGERAVRPRAVGHAER